MNEKEEIKSQILNLEKEFGRKPVKRDNATICQRARRIFGSWNNALKYCGFHVRDFQEISLPKERSKNFYYLMGLLITDGHIAMLYKEKKSYSVKLYTSFKEEKEMILRLINHLFKYRASVRERRTGFTNNLSYEIYISSKELCDLFVFLGIPAGEKSLDIRVPNCLFNETKENIISFIRGVIDGDGSINKNAVKICSGSARFLKDISKLFNKLNVSCGKVSCEKEKLFNLWICKKESLIRLRKLMYADTEYFYPRKKDSWFNKI